jgi:hypothetical protein
VRGQGKTRGAFGFALIFCSTFASRQKWKEEAEKKDRNQKPSHPQNK